MSSDSQQIATATSTTVAGSKKGPPKDVGACIELRFHRSAKSYIVKTCMVAQSLLRDYESRRFSNLFFFFLQSLVLKPIIDCFSLYQESN